MRRRRCRCCVAIQTSTSERPPPWPAWPGSLWLSVSAGRLRLPRRAHTPAGARARLSLAGRCGLGVASRGCKGGSASLTAAVTPKLRHPWSPLLLSVPLRCAAPLRRCGLLYAAAAAAGANAGLPLGCRCRRGSRGGHRGSTCGTRAPISGCLIANRGEALWVWLRQTAAQQRRRTRPGAGHGACPAAARLRACFAASGVAYVVASGAQHGRVEPGGSRQVAKRVFKRRADSTHKAPNPATCPLVHMPRNPAPGTTPRQPERPEPTPAIIAAPSIDPIGAYAIGLLCRSPYHRTLRHASLRPCWLTAISSWVPVRARCRSARPVWFAGRGGPRRPLPP
eukprot:353504-Chlamydomonas_euryale.AAC.4